MLGGCSVLGLSERCKKHQTELNIVLLVPIETCWGIWNEFCVTFTALLWMVSKLCHIGVEYADVLLDVLTCC